MWELALIVIIILNPIPVYFLFKAMRKDLEWKTDKGVMLIFGGFFSFLIELPTIVILIYFMIVSDVGTWIAWCWNDFWTMEVDSLTLAIFSIVSMICIWSAVIIKYTRKKLKKPICSKCNKKLDKKAVFCHNCGEKR